jgi:hypothetical protein
MFHANRENPGLTPWTPGKERRNIMDEIKVGDRCKIKLTGDICMAILRFDRENSRFRVRMADLSEIEFYELELEKLDDPDPARPKKNVRKIIERWENRYPNQDGLNVHATKELADAFALPGRIACVKLTGEYEV